MEQPRWEELWTSTTATVSTSWAATGAIILVATVIAAYVFKHDIASTVPTYTVELPAQCRPGWDGEILDEPQLKVGTSEEARVGHG